MDSFEFKPFANLRMEQSRKGSIDWSLLDFPIKDDLLVTLEFDSSIAFPEEKLSLTRSPAELIELCKNPGLGVRSLHRRGITGKGVLGAIIDQPLFLDHPEYNGKIVKYKDSVNDAENPNSMHGPAVTSLFVGNTTGTAPGASLYYANYASWLGNAENEIEALEWLLEQNELLLNSEKIKVVSISGNPKKFLNGEKWESAVKKANDQNVLVVDCCIDSMLSAPGHYNIACVDNISEFSFGYIRPNHLQNYNSKGIYSPVGNRTAAGYFEGRNIVPTYVYFADGGNSWAAPYLSGILCLGWQIAPQMHYTNMLEILFETAYIKDGSKAINPVAFIEKVESVL